MHSFSWPGRIWLTESPVLVFILLFLLSHLFYQRYFRQTTPGMASGVILMSLSFFAIVCLPLYHFPHLVVMVIALELLILWFYFAIELMQAYLHDEFSMDRLADRLSVGAWVTGTVMTALLLHQAEKTLHGFIILLGLTGVILYLFYLTLMVQWSQRYLQKRGKLQANGLILLVTISTQAIALLLSEIFQSDIPAIVYQVLISFGAFLYFLGFIVIVRYLFIARDGLAAVGWWNANNLVYGAVSMTGLAMLQSNAFPAWMVNVIGLFAILTFVVVAIIEVSRLLMRLQCKGWRKGVLSYHPSQWYRVFSFVALYAFALAYYAHEYGDHPFIISITHWGVYVVTLCVLAQMVLALTYVLRSK